MLVVFVYLDPQGLGFGQSHTYDPQRAVPGDSFAAVGVEAVHHVPFSTFNLTSNTNLP